MKSGSFVYYVNVGQTEETQALTTADTKEFLTPGEVARLLHVSSKTV